MANPHITRTAISLTTGIAVVASAALVMIHDGTKAPVQASITDTPQQLVPPTRPSAAAFGQR